ncbi:MAG: hypothetical protein E4H20_04815 [Spirochaetales bacterium]|nr:MAG: hypothetical protein E4H20_04815 [Spirochaetales bacterium]
MGIRLVYGLKTHDPAYLLEFFPARRLADAAKSMGLDYTALLFSPDTNANAIIDECRSHVALLRGELPRDLYETLEGAGIRTVNNAPAAALATDKYASSLFFSSMCCTHPSTVTFQIEAGQQCPPPKTPPFVVKPRFGKMGYGVALITSIQEWNEYLALAVDRPRPGNPAFVIQCIAQDYLTASHGRDVRFFFADWMHGDDRAGSGAAISVPHAGMPGVSSVCVKRSGPGFLSNAHAGGVMEPFDAPASLRSEAERIFNASGLDYGTVDFLFANSMETAFMVCELNACPGFEELERVTGLDAAHAILARVAARMERT